MSKYKTETHWRDAARPAKLFGIDAKAAFPLLLFLVHITEWTFMIALICTIFFGILARLGFTFRVFAYRMRALIAGRHKVAKPWWQD